MVEIDETRAVVEEGETHDGRIIPTLRAELDRAVRVYEDAEVTGSVYGKSVELDGGVIGGSVMASESVEVDGGVVDGEIGTPGKVTGEGTTVYGTVTGERVRLTEAVVYGNVVGTEVILEDCLVLGIVATDRALTLEGTLCYSFKAHGETTLDDVSVVLPQAMITEDTSLETPVTVTGLGRLETLEDDLPRMDEDDVVSYSDSLYLSLTPRILNLEQVADRLEQLEAMTAEFASQTSGEERPSPEDLLETFGVDESCYPAVV